MVDPGFLLDVNILVALTDDQHEQHQAVTSWFVGDRDRTWATCLLTQAAFVRLMSNPKVGGHSVAEATQVLKLLAGHSSHRFWPCAADWTTVAGHFEDRVVGHQQVTDACLLGMAIEQAGVLVTMDKGIRHLAGEQHRGSLLVLE